MSRKSKQGRVVEYDYAHDRGIIDLKDEAIIFKASHFLSELQSRRPQAGDIVEVVFEDSTLLSVSLSDEKRRRLREVLEAASQRVRDRPDWLRSESTRNQLQALQSTDREGMPDPDFWEFIKRTGEVVDKWPRWKIEAAAASFVSSTPVLENRTPARRCEITHNTCGTDTWAYLVPCKCSQCQAYMWEELDYLNTRLTKYEGK